MDNQKYFHMIRDIREVSIATVDKDGNPKVRIIDVMLVEGEKLYFVTARGKEFHKEIMDKKQIAVVGMNKEWQMLRFEGKSNRKKII